MTLTPVSLLVGYGSWEKQSPIVIPAGNQRQFPKNAITLKQSKSENKCFGLVNSGGEIPDTSIVDLGTSKGSFIFKYNTYQIPDQIDLFHGDNNIYSTGCLGS